MNSNWMLYCAVSKTQAAYKKRRRWRGAIVRRLRNVVTVSWVWEPRETKDGWREREETIETFEQNGSLMNYIFHGARRNRVCEALSFFFNLTSFTSHFTTLSAFLPSPHQHCVSLLRRKKWERKNSTHKQKWKVCALSTMLKLLERTRRESSRNIWFNVQRHLNHFSPNRYIDNTRSERNKSIYSHFVLVITRPDPLPVFSLFFFLQAKTKPSENFHLFSAATSHTPLNVQIFFFFFRVAISSRKIITFAACETHCSRVSFALLRAALISGVHSCSSSMWERTIWKFIIWNYCLVQISEMSRESVSSFSLSLVELVRRWIAIVIVIPPPYYLWTYFN